MSSSTTTSPAATGGVIHDIGYQRYTGARLGRAYAIKSLYAHGLRTAYGLGRSAGAKVFPWGVFGLLVGIAAILAAVRSQIGQPVTTYWEYPVSGVNLLVVLFCAIAAPELVSRDLRSGVLPLYFSRPLDRSDYPLAKWAALVSAVFLLLLAPLLVLYLGGAFLTTDISLVWDETVEFSKGLVTASVVALLYSSIALLISSLSGRRAISAAITVAVFILTSPVVAALQGIAIFQSGVFDSPDGEIGQMTGGPLRLYQLSHLASPLTIPDAIGAWLFQSGGTDTEGFVTERVGPFGPLYLGVTVALVAICVLLTLLRYRKVAR